VRGFLCASGRVVRVAMVDSLRYPPGEMTLTGKFIPKVVIERPSRLAVLISGGGRTLENLYARIEDGELEAEIAVVVCSREGIGGVERCRRLGLPFHVVDRREFDDDASFGKANFEIIRGVGVHLVCLAGYLKLLPVPTDFEGRVINIHPALLPDFGGKGMYGKRVHRAVLESGRNESGCTVHYVDDEFDHGEIIVQRRVAVCEGDTRAELAARVFEAECIAYPEAIRLLQGAGGRVDCVSGGGRDD